MFVLIGLDFANTSMGVGLFNFSQVDHISSTLVVLVDFKYVGNSFNLFHILFFCSVGNDFALDV